MTLNDSLGHHGERPARTRDEALAVLHSRVRGRVLTPDDPGYDSARRGFNLLVDQRPAIIVVAASADDVAVALDFAATEGLRVAVHATGHGPGRMADGAVLVNTSMLTDVSIDPHAATATVAAGATWGSVLGPAQEHGLAPLLGSSTAIGAVGYTLGGGIGWLSRKHGLCSDTVLSFDVVLPDGTAVRADDRHHRELFWALRGAGGGSFGVVTAMEIALVPVSTVYAGSLFYPAEMAAEVFARWRDWTREVSDELTSSAVLMNHPHLQAVPEYLRDTTFAAIRGVWSGDIDDGEALMDQWRSWCTPVHDTWDKRPFDSIDSVSMNPVDPMPSMVTTEWFEDLSDAALDVIVKGVCPRPGHRPTVVVAEIRHAGGAIRAGADSAANDRGRRGEFLLEVVSNVPDPRSGLFIEAHLRSIRHDLAPHVTGAAFLNFLDGEERSERSHTAFSRANLARLRSLKAELDPANRLSHGIDFREGG